MLGRLERAATRERREQEELRERQERTTRENLNKRAQDTALAKAQEIEDAMYGVEEEIEFVKSTGNMIGDMDEEIQEAFNRNEKS
jgi:hypothetical protein